MNQQGAEQKSWETTTSEKNHGVYKKGTELYKDCFLQWQDLVWSNWDSKDTM